MITIYLSNSNRKNKRFKAKVNDKTIHFGAKNGSTFIDHKDVQKKKNYIRRHGAMGNQNWNDLNTAGAWSRWLLWSEEDIDKAIKKIEGKFNVKIIIK